MIEKVRTVIRGYLTKLTSVQFLYPYCWKGFSDCNEIHLVIIMKYRF